MTISARPIRTHPEWMTIHEASSLMGVSPATLRRWSDAGRIRTFTTPGGHRRFSRTAVSDLLPAESADDPSWVVQPGLRLEPGPLRWLDDLDPTAQRGMGRLVRRLTAALIAVVEARTAAERAFSVDEAEPVATAFGALAAASGLPLPETVEALLGIREWLVQALIDGQRNDPEGTRTSVAAIEAATHTFDRLVVAAMRAHEEVRATEADHR